MVAPWVPVLWRILVVLSLIGSALVVHQLARPEGRWIGTLRSRFYRGVPWGSILVLGFVLFVYLVVQEGITYWEEPLALPFSAWSYFYPLGWLAGSFAHASPAHLSGNLTSAVILLPVVEYVWSHHADGESWRANPRVRAFVVFPLSILGLGVFTSLFSWGPVIGFSGPIFAFMGFVLVRYPLVAVIALAVRGAVQTVTAALGDPIAVVEASASVAPPWWYGIAVQSHLLGFLVGVLAGVALLGRRSIRPDPLRLWIGSLLVSLQLSLWAIWWIRGASTFVLYRALGVVFVIALATAITAAATATDHPFVGSLTPRQAAAAVLVIPLVGTCLIAVPLNLNVVNANPPAETITVGEYTIFYDENVTNEMISVVNVEAFGETTNVTTSGVIVVNEDREIWSREVSKAALETNGNGTVRVGGLTWSETITAHREGWVVGNETAYRIELAEDGERVPAYTSDPASVRGTIDDRSVSIVPESQAFYISLGGGDRAPIPDPGESTTIGDIEFVRNDTALIAAEGDTRVVIAERETYA